MMEKVQEFQAFQDPTGDNVLHSEVEAKGPSSSVEPRDTYDGDEDQLARLGKKQVLKVRSYRLGVM